YVLLQSNMQVSRAYLEKIAGHWSRANLSSAKEAMEFAKLQNQPYNTRTRATRQSKEVIPEWLQNRDKKTKDAPTEKNNKQVNDPDRAAMLERFKNTLE